MCIVPCIWGLRNFTVMSMLNLGVECPTPCSPICVNDASKPSTSKSFLLHLYHVFLRQPLALLPVTIVLPTFLGHVSESIYCRWPYQLKHPHLNQFSMLPNQLLNSFWWYLVCKLHGLDPSYHHITVIEMRDIFLCCSPHLTGIQ